MDVSVCGDGKERGRYTEACISEHEPHGGGSIMFWAGISFQHITELITVPRPALNAERYVADILDQHVRPMAEAYGENFILMQDNARPHSARITQEYL